MTRGRRVTRTILLLLGVGLAVSPGHEDAPLEHVLDAFPASAPVMGR